MSMIMNLRAVGDTTLDRLLKKPEMIESLLDDDDYDGAALDDELSLGDNNVTIDLDKSWHAIHFLLAGSAWEGHGPAAFLLAGGREIGDVDVGYGPARGLFADEVSDAAAALAAISPADLAGRFDPAKLTAAQIYPEIWNHPADEHLSYVREYYETLRNFVAATAAKGLGLIIYVT